MPLLEVEQLSVAFGSTPVVRCLSLAIERGERFGLIGESGSGKTMTALAICGLLPEGAQATGSLCLDDVEMPRAEKPMARLRGKRIGIVFQEPMTALNPLMRVGDQIGEAIALNQTDGSPGAEIGALLAEVGLETAQGRRYPHQLSGGQRQRVMIAQALASAPDLLIADEPTSALDLITQRRVLDLIASACERRGMALLFISHDLKAVNALCSRVMVMHRGIAVETGAAREVFARPQEDYTRKLVAAARPVIRTLTRAPVGRRLLEVNELVRRFRTPSPRWLGRAGRFAAVDGVSFTVDAAESVALVGPSGCGKSTLARILVGLDTASSGSIVFDGQSYRGADLPPSLRRAVTLVFQDPFGSFDPRMRIGEALAEPLRLEGKIGAATRVARVAEAIAAVGLDPVMAGRFAHEFSGGQRQRLAIARALVTRPRLVVLDEPVSALDMSVRGEVLDLLARLRADFGLTLVIISHDLDMVREVADRVLVMDRGKIVESGRPRDLFENPQHAMTRELIAARLPEVG